MASPGVRRRRAAGYGAEDVVAISLPTEDAMRAAIHGVALLAALLLAACSEPPSAQVLNSRVTASMNSCSAVQSSGKRRVFAQWCKDQHSRHRAVHCRADRSQPMRRVRGGQRGGGHAGPTHHAGRHRARRRYQRPRCIPAARTSWQPEGVAFKSGVCADTTTGPGATCCGAVSRLGDCADHRRQRLARFQYDRLRGRNARGMSGFAALNPSHGYCGYDTA